MKKLVYLFLFLLAGANTFNAFAQKDINHADLEALYTAIQKTPSYKKLLKGDKSYEQLYEDVKLKIADADEKQVFWQLSRLVSAVNDNHLGFYRTPDTTLKPVRISLPVNTDSLKKQLQQKDKDALEGIYYASNHEFGLFASGDRTYKMISLANGILMAEVFHTPYDGYDLLLYSGKPVPYNLIKDARQVNGTLLGTPFTKYKENKFSILDKGNENFEYKALNDKVGYLRLSSFSSSNANIKKSEEFHATILGKLTTENLIVDLRGNTGGGYKTSRKFLDLLKKYKGQIFVLQNSATVSNAEQFILDLKPLKKVTTLGEQTKGMITFGSNYGTKVVLPSERFTFSPTDMKGLERDLAYESKGINPDVALDLFKSDWITQTLEYINKR
ncbi:S41 family peptidase [Pedobacter ureilyticus]|uniref:S41 family peptidase n=1 Tax=Pedobacter ureilyticus TaxID=1393051 RepID=A0ABW9J5X5_9SPHI|nr:S41 family peptidase [Pedobacter helvus]